MISGLGARAGAVLSDVSSTEGRLAVTAAIGLLTLAVGWLLLPKAVRAGEQTVSSWIERLVDDRLAESTEGAIETFRDGVPSSFLLRLSVGLLQLALFALAGVAVLTLWGRFELVVAVLPVAENAFRVGAQVVASAMLLGGAYVVSDVVEAYVSDLSADSDRITAHQEQLLTRLAQVGLLVLAAITVLGIWGVNLGGLLVGAGFLGIVLGMAARQTLGSLIAGFVLMFARPFEIGDWVEIGDEEGFVTDITIMNTHMRNFDGEYVVVPNDLVANQAITNRSREGRLRIHMEVGIGYDDDPDEAAGIAEEVLDDIGVIANNPQPYAIPSGFGDSAILLDLRFWIDPPTPQARWRSKALAVERIQDRFADAGISIPYPQRTVSYPPEKAAADETVERVERADENGSGRPRDDPV
ncbi:MscS Mechanosensitive ion channel [Halorubrum californiense DSM 19288]|uniref:MscS Mechanosensitive ion channel n=1 Tax=Halorubrum californiense DSM 19288 TaxID=1227465 RepID=M0EHA0_9EURY|nr:MULTISPECIES: mechanosensitive ion channel family protein [Halorubrum]ELZ45794.1 MscS Mechanosensitive ion channel [Halorubrum californiense DSM 19288]TKX66158.1 mechanosensitive ion channel family protein [Halorubrum sp. GN11GM_10-3_MGM]